MFVKRVMALVVMIAGVIMANALPAVAGLPMDPWTCRGTSYDSETDSGGRLVDVYCNRVSGGASIQAVFYPLGEWLYVYDNYDNDQATVAYLTVQGYGTKTLKTGDHNLSYPEGRAVSLRICTSSGGFCSTVYSGGRT